MEYPQSVNDEDSEQLRSLRSELEQEAESLGRTLRVLRGG